jgi:hypothetical protein
VNFRAPSDARYAPLRCPARPPLNTYSKALEEFQRCPRHAAAPLQLRAHGLFVRAHRKLPDIPHGRPAPPRARAGRLSGPPRHEHHRRWPHDPGPQADAHGEDKLAKAARELGWDPFHVAQHFLTPSWPTPGPCACATTAAPRPTIPACTRAPPATSPRCWRSSRSCWTRPRLRRQRGQVYFSIESFPEYGDLSGKVIDELEAGARVEVREEKRDPRDFALWKVDPSTSCSGTRTARGLARRGLAAPAESCCRRPRRAGEEGLPRLAHRVLGHVAGLPGRDHRSAHRRRGQHLPPPRVRDRPELRRPGRRGPGPDGPAPHRSRASGCTPST